MTATTCNAMQRGLRRRKEVRIGRRQTCSLSSAQSVASHSIQRKLDIALFAPDVKKFANRDASIDLSNCVHSSHFVRINSNKEGRAWH